MVLQCRDEGEVRSKVQWSRPGGRRMPKHTRQKNGRLEIKRIGIHEGGKFICSAIGFEKEKRGRAVAYVKVLKYY